jgi:hypothetical protein
MRIRGITKEDIIDAIYNPDKKLNDSLGNIITLKLKRKYLFLRKYNSY